jgi:hypothetical protein
MSEQMMRKLFITVVMGLALMGCRHTPSAQPNTPPPSVVQPTHVRTITGKVVSVIFREKVDNDTDYRPELTSIILQLPDGTTERLSFPEQGDLRPQFQNGGMLKIDYVGVFHSAMLIKVTVL